jgi:hypothetical protein
MSKIFTVDFTQSFIDELAAYIEREYLLRGRSLERLAIVFGGKRPAHFLKRALAEKIGSAFLPPRLYTIDELMDELADFGSDKGAYQMAGELEDAFEIYTLARELTPELLEGRNTFSKFLPWAGDILDFIKQLDLEDVDDKALRNIQDSARIGFPVPENINRLLEKVLILRRAFHACLAAKGRTSRGLQYLRAKEHVAQWPGVADFDEIILANFFYFHKTEEAVIKHLYAAGKATLMFQGDQSKWDVLKHIARKFGCELREGPTPTPTSFKLQAYSAFDVHSEAAVVRDVLSGIKDKSRAVIILPDPGALVPLLSALPEDTGELNVSMGYSLKRGSLYLLLEAVFKAQNSRREDRYYAKDYLAVMSHPFVKNTRTANGEGEVLMRILVHKLEEVLKGHISSESSGRSFITLQELESEDVLFNEALDTLRGMGVDATRQELKDLLRAAHAGFLVSLEGVQDLGHFAVALSSILERVAAGSAMAYYPLNGQIAARIHELCDELKTASFAGEVFEFEEIVRIFEQRVGKEMVNFSGTPLKGLQVLGLEETRSLNFDHVIVMDVNEGVLPRINVSASLIPREVMSLLSLDRLELEEEIQRYQFMRVISSAKTVHLVYQKNKQKEPSRFLEELVWEKQLQAGCLQPYPTLRAGFKVRVTSVPRQVKKTAKMLAFLKDLTYSASSINAYVANPYTFYMTYVLGLREEEDLLDEPDARLVGDFLHKMLEEVYKPFEGGELDLGASFETRLNAVFERRFEETFIRRMRSDAFLVRGVMEHKLRQFLEAERERAPGIARLLGLERDFTILLPFSGGDVRFKARVDRIEEGRDGKLLVLDYKTGGSDKLPKRPLVLSDAPDREEIFENVVSFQLPLYMHVVAREFSAPVVNAGLYSLRDARINALFSDKFREQPAADFLKPYFRALDVIVSEILDPEKPFVDDELKKYDF